MHTITDLSLVTGPVPPVVTVLGILALLWLIFSRSRRHVLISIPVCIVAAIAITLVLYWLIEKVWHPFPDPIARPVYVWIGLGILGVLLGVSRVFAATRIDGRVLTVVSVLSGGRVERGSRESAVPVVSDVGNSAGTLGRGEGFTRRPGRRQGRGGTGFAMEGSSGHAVGGQGQHGHDCGDGLRIQRPRRRDLPTARVFHQPTTGVAGVGPACRPTRRARRLATGRTSRPDHGHLCRCAFGLGSRCRRC